MPDPIQLTLYANGILMFEGPFRPFTEPSTRSCVQDIMDGYFPGELQERYPDGVPFIVSIDLEVIIQSKYPDFIQLVAILIPLTKHDLYNRSAPHLNPGQTKINWCTVTHFRCQLMSHVITSSQVQLFVLDFCCKFTK